MARREKVQVDNDMDIIAGVTPIMRGELPDLDIPRTVATAPAIAELEARVLAQSAAIQREQAAGQAGDPILDADTLARVHRVGKNTCQVFPNPYPSLGCETFTCHKTSGVKFFIGRPDGPYNILAIICEDCLRQMLASLPDKYLMEMVKAKGLALVEAEYADGMEGTVDALSAQVDVLTAEMEQLKAGKK